MKTAKIIEVLKDFRALKPLEQVNQLEYYAEVIHSLHELPTEEEIMGTIRNYAYREIDRSQPIIEEWHFEKLAKAIYNLLNKKQ